MKAFSVFLAILFQGLLGAAIACPQGFKGPLCDEKCTMYCNDGLCDWRNETEVCICDETKWTGPSCEEARPCAYAKCDHGRCEPYNSTLISFICVCDDGYKGDRCDQSIIDLCIGQSRITCENDATCAYNKCVCKDGFGGERCENRVPFLSEYKSSRCDASCAAVFANKKCNDECNTAECFYDGLDCYEQPELDEDKTDSPWYVLERPAYCMKYYGNGVCDKECNKHLYGFDGGDCEKELRGTVTSRIQISLGVHPTVVNLSHKFLLAYLAQILRARVSISKSKKDNQPDVFSIVNATGIEERITLDDSLSDRYADYTKLILDVDASFCKDEHCLRLNDSAKTIRSAITLLGTVFVRSEEPLSFPSRSEMVSFIVLDVVAPEEPASSWIEIFLAVIISMLITMLLALLVFGCWLVRRRHRLSKMSKEDGGAPNRWIDHYKNRLIVAVEEGNISSLTSLLSEMSPVEAANAEDVAGNTVLHMAAARDDKVVVQLLLHSRMFDVCSVNSIGQSPLLYSLRESKPGLETLTLLVNAINDAKLRQRATSQSTRNATNHLMLTALSEEAGWGLTDAVGRSALHHAALAGRPSHIIHFLVSHGASPGLQDSSGNTPLHLAAINGHSDTVQALLDERAAVTVTNSLGNTPAKVCSLNGHTDLASLLYEKELAVSSAPYRLRNDSQRETMYSTAESVFSDEPDEFVLPSLLTFGADATPLRASSSSGGDGQDVAGCRLSGLGSFLAGAGSGPGARGSAISGSCDALRSTPTPTLPKILTPSSQLVETLPELQDNPPLSTLPRKCLYGVERSPSDPRPSQLTQPYGTMYGKRRSLPDGPSLTANYRDVMLSPVHFAYGTNTMSTTSERSQSSAGHDSLVSSFRPPPLS